VNIRKKLERIYPNNDEMKLLIGKELVFAQKNMVSDQIIDYEFKVFSQFGDDGIIQHLINKIKPVNKTFIEFGVGDYSECNTRFLLMNNNWSGFVMEGDEKAVEKIKKWGDIWKYDLRAKKSFITKENINSLLKESGFKDVGLLHIDMDGVDYWIWETIDCSELNPSIVILEYNSVLGSERAITVPYQDDFNRTKAHYSNLYWGASLKALVNLSKKKGYKFIGCNSAGNNAYFVKKEIAVFKELTVEEGFVESKYRESRNKNGELSYLRGSERIEVIRGMLVFNVESGVTEVI